MATTHASTRHFGDLDGMRGLLAVLVMLYHYGLNTIINAFVPLGVVEWTLCVDIFFLLSGLVLCRSVEGKGAGALQFARKRFGRLFPMHWAILLIFAPVFLATGAKLAAGHGRQPGILTCPAPLKHGLRCPHAQS